MSECMAGYLEVNNAKSFHVLSTTSAL